MSFVRPPSGGRSCVVPLWGLHKSDLALLCHNSKEISMTHRTRVILDCIIVSGLLMGSVAFVVLALLFKLWPLSILSVIVATAAVVYGVNAKE